MGVVVGVVGALAAEEEEGETCHEGECEDDADGNAGFGAAGSA